MSDGDLVCCPDCGHYWSLQHHDRASKRSYCTIPFCDCEWEE